MLLDALGISVDVTRLGEVAWKTIFRYGSAVGDTSVISVVVLDSSSHWPRVSLVGHREAVTCLGEQPVWTDVSVECSREG